ncbi:MAG: M23 family metallopeptidase [Alphaproteobacteria bacterium]
MPAPRHESWQLARNLFQLTLKPRFRRILFPAVAAVMIVGVGTFLLLQPTSEQKDTIGETTHSPIEPSTIASPPIPDAVRLPSDPLTASNPIEAETKIVKGDTLSAVLKRMGVSNDEAALSIKALRKVYDPRSLRKGDKVTLSLSSDSSNGTEGRLLGLQIAEDFDRIAGVALSLGGKFEAYEIVKSLDKSLGRGKGSINSSLFEDGVKSGIPAGIMVNFIRLFSFDIDFQRDIQSGDQFDVLFDQFIDYDGSVVSSGDILYASLTTGKRTLALYRYEFSDGRANYFNDKGRSNRKALLRTPIDGARISSGFGRRKHPILGYSKMHAGVDFAAPSGTPIRAAGDGVIRRAGWNGGYGRYVRIRHNSIYQTAYAHMRRIAKGIKAGVRVQQGQIIGYVGSSGRSTGPHLHYEILKQGRQVNPRKVKFQSAEVLAGDDLAKFKNSRERISKLLVTDINSKSLRN